MTQRLLLGVLVMLLLIATAWVHRQYPAVVANSVSVKLGQRVPVQHEPSVDCAAVAAQHPLVLLALGQSNAGNHGQLVRGQQPPLLLVADGKCLWAADPLPGSTGSGGSIWSRLPAQLAAAGLRRPVVLSLLAVDATSIADWTAPASPLPQRLRVQVEMLQALHLPPHAVLWQQGEADARLGTTSAAYREGMKKLAQALYKQGLTAPLLIATSTLCRSAPSGDISAAVRQLIVEGSPFRPGPDTDMLTGSTMRYDGCHFSEQGLDAAARLWAIDIKSLVVASVTY